MQFAKRLVGLIQNDTRSQCIRSCEMIPHACWLAGVVYMEWEENVCRVGNCKLPSYYKLKSKSSPVIRTDSSHNFCCFEVS